QTLNWIEDIAPSEAVLTNMHNDLDYATVEAETPANVTPAYDGMVIRRPIP
ncbi:MAG: MBL fold metallo-hydrolase, partial [Dinoroseobacter sp.]|nr:MBL fold metallo-hydrolase [Dinoroseobacter sp.]